MRPKAPWLIEIPKLDDGGVVQQDVADHQDAGLLGRQGHQPPAVFGVQRQRLFDEHVFARLQTLPDDVIVRRRPGRHSHRPDAGIGQHVGEPGREARRRAVEPQRVQTGLVRVTDALKDTQLGKNPDKVLAPIPASDYRYRLGHSLCSRGRFRDFCIWGHKDPQLAASAAYSSPWVASYPLIKRRCWL